ncbi:unnamed protein product [Phytophthora fragariaefolia]|uniref:Unnamed protein product n=1 Tax=Phytophthora fragariaefolia TaxID=1490495 RepID=A0A9W6XS08_9STRA|nr:unnamed protein product [Phytophthora fragariaefolia]
MDSFESTDKDPKQNAHRYRSSGRPVRDSTRAVAQGLGGLTAARVAALQTFRSNALKALKTPEEPLVAASARSKVLPAEKKPALVVVKAKKRAAADKQTKAKKTKTADKSAEDKVDRTKGVKGGDGKPDATGNKAAKSAASALLLQDYSSSDEE